MSDSVIGKFRFRVDLDGITAALFRGISGLRWEAELLEFQEGGRNDGLVKLPGQNRHGTVTLKRGYCGSRELQKWAEAAHFLETTSDSVRRSVDLVVLRNDGSEAVRYTLQRAWPQKWEGPEMSGDSEVAVESLELAYEALVTTPVQAGAPSANPGGAGANPPASGVANPASRARPPASPVAPVAGALQAAAGAAASLNPAALVARVNGAIAAGPSVLAPASATPPNLPAVPNAPVPPRPPVPPDPATAVRSALQSAAPLPTIPHPSPPDYQSALQPPAPPAPPARPAAPTIPGPPAPPSPPAPPPFPAPAPGQGLAPLGSTAAPSVPNAPAWSDGVAAQQSPPSIPQPPLQPGNTLTF